MHFSSKTNRPKSKPVSSKPDTFFQAQLNVGQPGDKYEQEADQMADQVVHGLSEVNPASATDHTVQSRQEEEIQTEEVMDTPVQEKPLAEHITPIVQTQIEEEQVQEKEEEELQKKEDEELQKNPEASEEDDPNDQGTLQAKSDQNPSVSPALESQIRSGGGGSQMDPDTRSSMESGFGADFSNVKVHTDSSAVQMSQDMGAQAFTHGNDIYFNEGKYDPGSTSGQHLLAHELTHTVQQGSSSAVQGKMVQREGEDNQDGNSNQVVGDLSTGQVNNSNSTITYASIPITGFKRDGHRGEKYDSFNLKRHKNYSGSRQRNNVNQRDIWRRDLNTDEIETSLQNKYNQATGVETSRSGRYDIYAFKIKESERGYLTGTLNNIVREASTPKWNDQGESPTYFQVDHIVEMQISGYPDVNDVNDIGNMELLNASENILSGGIIREAVENKVGDTIDEEDSLEAIKEKFPQVETIGNKAEKITFIKNNYHLVFNSSTAGDGPSSIGSDKYWTQEQIEKGDHLELLQPMSMSELGSADSMLIFPRRYHPIATSFTWDGSNQSPTSSERYYFSPWIITSKNFITDPDSEVLGHFNLEFPSEDPIIRATGGEVEIKKLPGAQFAGYVDNVEGESASRHSVISAGNIAAKQFSPVRLDLIDFNDQGVIVEGKVLPTLGFIEEAELDLSIRDGEAMVSKTFSNEDFSLPAPFNLKYTSLTLFGSSTRGLGISGQVNFGIDQVGEGHIGAAASTSGGFELEGAFNFDSDLFDPAEINVEYKDNIWAIGGEIGIPEGKVRGVKSATINATYSENTFSAEGEAELDIPGIERGSMSIEYGEEGFSIGGNFDLSSDVPGITGGNVEARVSKAPEAEEYEVFVSGTAQPDIPGITSSLTVTYDNGALTIEGSASYSRGMLSGTVNVGATNRAIGDDGQPTGEPDDTMRVYGGGELTLQLTPWLAATAGVNFTPEGEIEVTARLASDSYEVFRRREINRNLFTVPTIEIPLFAIPLGPRSIGLVAQIGGGLDFTAGFGPGELRNLSAEITYNPEREEETTVSGHGEFAIPADAGLTLRGDLSLGVSVAIASLSGGIELAGTLGLEGEAAAGVDVNWSPQTGLTLDAEGSITVNPKFTFELNAFARASLGVGWLSISETWRHNLASYEWGPDIQFGIVFPVHYQEGEAFDMSFDDIEVIYPDLDVVDMAKGLARDVKNDLFD